MPIAGGNWQMKELHLPTKARLTSDLVPDLALTHAQTLWVLENMGFSAGIPTATFNHYIKSLRKLGTPFAYGKAETRGGRRAYYSYNHLMELCLALSLRVYGAIPDRILAGIIEFREELYALYRRAYIEFATGLGAPIRVTAKGRTEFEMSGVYLDLRIRFGGGRALEFGPPRAVSPFEALRAYARLDTPGRAHLPFNLSTLAIDLVECAETAPDVHPGPHKD
jgi:hypothetical protein